MDSLDTQDPVATAQIPLLRGTRQQMAKALLQNEPYYSMLRFFPQMAESASDLPDYILCNNSRTRQQANARAASLARPKQYEHEKRTQEMMSEGMKADFRRFTLFHAIPRPALESVVLGTVAHDYHGNRSIGREHYKHKGGFGIYAVGLAVDNRNGAWLTANELNVMVGNLEKYIQGYEDWKTHRGDPDCAQSRQSWDLVRDVDNQIGKTDAKTLRESGPQPRFCNTDGGRSGMQDLCKTLRKMAQESLRLDPTGRTRLIQTPLYIGCSVGVGGRLEQHSLKLGNSSTLQQSNKGFGLVACLMNYQNLIPREVGICVVRLWDTKDIPYSEVLVCSLANSLICQDGFNRIECGDSTTNKPLDREGEEYIKARTPYLNENLTESLREIEARSSFIQEFRQLQPEVNKEEENLRDNVIDDLENLENDISLVKGLKADCRRATAAWEASQDKSRQELEDLELFGSLLDTLRI